jgi:hypothetical protein
MKKCLLCSEPGKGYTLPLCGECKKLITAACKDLNKPPAIVIEAYQKAIQELGNIQVMGEKKGQRKPPQRLLGGKKRVRRGKTRKAVNKHKVT